jgi:hypothetical protein
MASRAQTLLTKIAAPVAEQLAARGSLKMVLSGAVIAFNRLSAEERERFYDLANGIKTDENIPSESPRQQLHNGIKILKEIVEVERQQPGTVYRVLNLEEQKVMDDFRKLISSEGKKRSKTA